MDADDVTLFSTGSYDKPDQREQLAHEIATAINRHDELTDALARRIIQCSQFADALKFYAQRPHELRNSAQPDQPGTFNDWCGLVCRDSGDIARAALAKLEEKP